MLPVLKVLASVALVAAPADTVDAPRPSNPFVSVGYAVGNVVQSTTRTAISVFPKLNLHRVWRGWGSSRPSRRKPMELVELRLRELVGQQESWFVQHARYGRDAFRIGSERPGDSTAHFEVQVEILYAGTRGWTAIGSHPSAPGRTCVVYVGFRERLPILPRTHRDGVAATLEGMPACDR